MRIVAFCFLFVQAVFAQLPNVSFNATNNWTSGAGVSIDIPNNQAQIIGNGTNYLKTTLDVNLTTIPNDFYFTVDVFLSGVTYNSYNIKNPQVVVKDNTGSLVGRMNLDAGLENTWFKTGIRITNYNANLLKLELGMNGTTGTMLVKNPVLTVLPPAFTYEFPFTVPSNVSTSLSVNLNTKHPFQNDLLSTNSHFVYASYQWGDNALNTAINTYFPMTNLRFPGGTVGNYYNYQTDTFYNNANTPNNLATIAANGYLFKYNGFKNLVINSNASATLMFNVMTNTPLQSKNEYQNRVNSGLPIKWVEMGNEMYAAGNQTGNITDVTTYISHTQQVAANIKTVNPNAKVAVCLEKDDFTIGDWNHTLSQNQNYFDAATLHNYIDVGSYFYSKYAAYNMLKSYKISNTRFMAFDAMFPTKPLLLTEWGITTETTEPYFLQTLGVADAFLAIENANKLGIVEQAGIHMLYKNDENSEATLMYKGTDNLLRLTSRGVLYAKLFEVFKNAEVYDADVTSPDLEANLKSVYGKMVKKGTNYKLFLVNKLPVVSPFTLQVNGTNYTGNYTMETYTENLNVPTIEKVAGTNVWNSTSGTGTINLPASSIVIVTIPEANLNPLATSEIQVQDQDIVLYPNPSNDYIRISGLENLKDLDYSISVVSVLGKQMNVPIQDFVLDIQSLPSGVYFLNMKFGNAQILSKKIIKI